MLERPCLLAVPTGNATAADAPARSLSQRPGQARPSCERLYAAAAAGPAAGEAASVLRAVGRDPWRHSTDRWRADVRTWNCSPPAAASVQQGIRLLLLLVLLPLLLCVVKGPAPLRVGKGRHASASYGPAPAPRPACPCAPASGQVAAAPFAPRAAAMSPVRAAQVWCARQGSLGRDPGRSISCGCGLYHGRCYHLCHWLERSLQDFLPRLRPSCARAARGATIAGAGDGVSGFPAKAARSPW